MSEKDILAMSVNKLFRKQPKKRLTLRLSKKATDYFNNMAVKYRLSFPTIINLYLSDSAHYKKRLKSIEIYRSILKPENRKTTGSDLNNRN